MDCPNCRSEVPPGSKFCPFCGNGIAEATPATCLTCAQPVTAGQHFCSSCGAPLAGRLPSSPSRAESVEPKAEPTPKDGAIESLTAPEESTKTLYPTSYTRGEHVTQATPGSAPRKARRWQFWVPFIVLIVPSLLVYWAADATLEGWAVLVALFGLLFVLRGRLSGTGALATLGIWLFVLIVLVVRL